MSIPAHDLQMSKEDYLSFEESASRRHEFVAGRIFAMTGATDAHNTIVTNLAVLIGAHVRGTGCRLYINDMKVLIESSDSFYYPDLMVSCEPFSSKSVFKKSPSLIVEVLSPSTAEIDLREKLQAYKSVSSLSEYLIVYQDKIRVELYRRVENGWAAEVCESGCFNLRTSPAAPEMSIPLLHVYEGVFE